MQMYGIRSSALAPKFLLLALETTLIAASYICLFRNGFEWMGLQVHPGAVFRRELLFAFNLIVFVRMLLTILYFLKRRLPWEEVFSIPLAFALYYLGFAYLGYGENAAFGMPELLGITLFLLGSAINTGAEFQRDVWKKLPENKGRLYTTGLFRYSMHINYFGDLLWVAGYAFVTRNPYSAGIVLFLLCFFVFFNIPKLDRYLASRYGDDFVRYRAASKRLIPFVY